MHHWWGLEPDSKQQKRCYWLIQLTAHPFLKIRTRPRSSTRSLWSLTACSDTFFYRVLGIYGHILASMLAMPPPRIQKVLSSVPGIDFFCSLQFSVESNNLPIRFSLQKHTHGALSNSLWCKWIWDVSSSILLAKWLITLEQSKEHGAKGWLFRLGINHGCVLGVT